MSFVTPLSFNSLNMFLYIFFVHEYSIVLQVEATFKHPFM